jgi:hypothetical protein
MEVAMRDSLDDLELDLGRLPEPRTATDAPHSSVSPAQQIRRALRGKHVCPFCGTQRDSDVGPCMHCSLEDTPTTRSATRSKLGPWYVLQSRNPSAPGMNFATLMVLVQKGRVTARSVVRGPTTGQFWRHAAKIKGLSREFGLCWNCGGDVTKNARACASCKRLQEPPLNPDVLLESAELGAEELAEAMWSDQVPASSQMAGSSHMSGSSPMGNSAQSLTSAPSSPRNPPSPVDRLVARGGVRRELPPQYPPSMTHGEMGAGTLPPRPQRGLLAEAAEDLPSSGLELAVFQRHGRPEAYRFGGGGVVLKVSKVLLVALLLSSAVLVAWCSFDDQFRGRMIGVVHDLKAWVKGEKTSSSSAKPSSALPVTSDELAQEAIKEKAWELWKVGDEAEKRGDFAGAVRSFEAIKALNAPENLLPLTLDARLAAAKKKVK